MEYDAIGGWHAGLDMRNRWDSWDMESDGERRGMTTRIDDALAVSSSNTGEDYEFSATQVIARLVGRTVMPATYQTFTSNPTVYYTALNHNGSVLTGRTTSGITLVNGLYYYSQLCVNITEFTAIWDEGDQSDYVSELIAVDL